MKVTIIICIICIIGMHGHSQPAELSMGQTTGKTYQGQYTYFSNETNQPYTGILYAKYPNGNYLSRQEFKNGIGNGTWTNYYENGHISEQGTYVDNRVEGAIKKYYDTGILKSEGIYREWRIRVGEWKYYDAEGQLKEIINHGAYGDFRDVDGYYQRGEISKAYYEKLKKSN